MYPACMIVDPRKTQCDIIWPRLILPATLRLSILLRMFQHTSVLIRGVGQMLLNSGHAWRNPKSIEALHVKPGVVDSSAGRAQSGMCPACATTTTIWLSYEA